MLERRRMWRLSRRTLWQTIPTVVGILVLNFLLLRLIPGDAVDVCALDGRYLGRGFFNPNSQIAIRMLTRWEEPITRSFFERRIRQAWAYRQKVADLAAAHPDKVRVLPFADLNESAAIEALFDWLGLPATGRRLELLGTKVNPSPPNAD